jgi:ABC-type Fe3+/spermidine/putrescine transport system ATPase subunit
MLQLHNLTLRIGSRQLLDRVSLTIPPGQAVALLGASGSGKSTLLRIVAGLEQPDTGAVLWDGADITATPPERRRFALMFQDFALFPHLNVQDNVAFGLVEHGWTRAAARLEAKTLLSAMQLSHKATDFIAPLSGGEQQRVALARALVTRPRALLLDEPFSALDTELRLQLRHTFVEHIQSAGMATVLVTHDETDARFMCKHAWRLSGGSLTQCW